MCAKGPAFPDGHFYSPVVNIDQVSRDQRRIWEDEPELVGVDLNELAHKEFLAEEFARYIREYDYPDEPPADGKGHEFYTCNSQFSWLDSRALFVMLRAAKPHQMIEVGSGFSSLLTADVNRRFLGGGLDFTCIEPYPRPFLLGGVLGISRLILQKIEDVPTSIFADLHRGDILFIDSSHVSKTGSDVNHILFEILPRLRSGVIIHFHDIFFPYDYPKEWVLGEGRSWNEQYLVRALLTFTNAFKIIFGSAFAYCRYPDLLRELLGGQVFGGASLWLRKIK